MDPERAATPSGLAAETVSVHDRDPGMLGDSPPAPGVCAPPSSPQLRKSRSRRRKGSPSVETVSRVKAPAGRETVSARPSPPCIGPAAIVVGTRNRYTRNTVTRNGRTRNQATRKHVTRNGVISTRNGILRLRHAKL